MTTRTLLLCLLACGFVTLLSAQNGGAPRPTLVVPTPSADEVVFEMPVAEALQAPVSRDSETISIDFPDEEIRTIVRNVADLYEINVVIPDSLTGNISIKLRNVTWRQVFDVVLEGIGYTWIEDRNIVKILSRDELALEAVVTIPFFINFAPAQDLAASISPLIDAAVGGRVQVDRRSNALIITERPSRMKNIQEIIERLDRPNEQVMIESKFVEVTNRDIKNLGVNWPSMQGYQLGAGPFSREYDSSRTRERDDSVGSSSSATGGTGGPGPTTTSLDDLRNLVYGSSLGRADTAIFNASSFNVVLAALQSDNNIEVVSNPTVVTVNNTAAQINIGEEFPIPQYTYNDQRGTFEISGFEYKPIGIILNVTPQVNSAGFINLNITPEISTRTGVVSFGGASGADIPIITTRKTQSTVTIKSGFTLAIGGLIEKTDSRTLSRVPVLSSVPIMGNLFRHRANNIDRRNLIIFITAKILSADGSTYRDVFSKRTLYEMGIKSRDLPGYEPPDEEEALFEDIQRARDALEQIQAETRLQMQLETLRQNRERELKKSEREPRPVPRRNLP